MKVPDEDFDFSENLAKFNKSELTSKAEESEQVLTLMNSLILNATHL